MKTQKGITLIALVITVIVLLILAGIALNRITGENGILKNAENAVGMYNNKVKEEQTLLNNIEILFNNKELPEELPENTPEIEAGTIVAIPEKWLTTMPSYVSTTNGEQVVAEKQVASVYAVSTGNGETVPVPHGFFYVGGTINSGVVISDNENDKNKEAGKTDVTKNLEGNQFVWIPCTESKYKKTEWGYENDEDWDRTIPTAEKTQIKKYGGFYVGRYEAGTSEASFTGVTVGDAVSATTKTIDGSNHIWYNDCYTIGKASSTSKPTSKANEIPWFHVDYKTALEGAERMYNTNYVHSGLITGTQWDVMVNWMSEQTDKSDVKTNCKWGNYKDIGLTDCTGKYTTINTDDGSTSAWSENTTGKKANGTVVILTTGATEQVKKRNLYDVAGNLWEWTSEADFYYAGSKCYMRRGGTCSKEFGTNPVCCRDWNLGSSAFTNEGFRVTLYIK